MFSGQICNRHQGRYFKDGLCEARRVGGGSGGLRAADVKGRYDVFGSARNTDIYEWER